MSERPKTTRAPGSLQGWVSIALVALGGLVGSYVSFEVGAATTAADLTALTARVGRLEAVDVVTRLAALEAHIKHTAEKNHSHRKGGR